MSSWSLIFLMMALLSCAKKEKNKVDPDFAKYVSAFTYGIISNQSTIKVQLVQEVPSAKPGEAVKEELLEFSPNIEGKAFWLDQHTIEFRPKDILPSGTEYEAEFQLATLVSDVPTKLEVLEFTFQVIKQAAFIGEQSINPYDNQHPEFQQLSAVLISADFAKNDVIEKIFSATQNDKKLHVSWSHQEDGRTHRFIVDSVERKVEVQSVLLHCATTQIGADSDNDLTIEIPSLNDFTVFNSIVVNEPEQCITLNFSDPLSDSVDITGLIYLANSSAVRLSAQGNMVKVFPTSRVTGEVELVVTRGVKSVKGYALKEEYRQKIMFNNIKPNVEILGSGVILPSTNGLVLPFQAVNLKAIDLKIVKIYSNNIAQFFQVNQYDGDRELSRVGRVEFRGEIALTATSAIDYGKWNTFSLDLSKYIKADPGAIYRVYLSFRPEYSFYACPEVLESAEYFKKMEEQEENEFDGPTDSYYYYDEEEYYYYDNGYEWEERDNPCHISYYIDKKNKNVRNILASDLGIIAKGGNGSELLVAVTDLKSTEPLSEIEVELYNYQNQLIVSGHTDGDGFVTLQHSKKPYLLVAKRGEERGYLRLDDGSSLSLSMFDVSGSENKKGVKGFIYGERGVWRPGDSLYVSFMLEDKNNVIPGNHPVLCEVYNPNDQLYKKWVKNTSVNGLYDFRFATNIEDPTGNWICKIKVGGSEFSKTLKIETVKPNRLKINLDFGTEVLKSSGVKEGKLNVKWLHGAKAKNLKVDVEMNIKEGSTAFKGFDNYTFDDPTRHFESEQKNIFEGSVDENGNAIVKTEISTAAQAPGMLNCFFKTRAFEQGGDFSTDQFQILYSPYASYVGVKIPEGKGWNGALYSDKSNVINIATVDENNRAVDRQNIKVEIYDVNWRWWWDYSDEDESGNYVESSYRTLTKTEYVSTKNGKLLYDLTFDKPSWGRKMIKITDPVSGHSCGKVFYTTYSSWWNEGGHGPGGPEMLTFSTDKSKYNVGEKVVVQLPKVKEGRALVSIESGSKVIRHFWHELDGNSFDFEATEAMAPNVFVHVSLIQPHNSTANDVPIRMYGVQAILVEDKNTHLHPLLQMANVLAPEQEATLKVSEQEGRAMSYTIAVVDEGLLDLTRFKTPDPWPVFYTKEALGIKTWDLYKYVIGAYNGKMAGLLAVGGDEALNAGAGKKINRFVPVVKFLGPFYLEPGQSKTHKYKMPNYVGSVRTMIVASDNGAYGNTEKTTAVKKPLMVISTLPRVLGPKEKVKVPVTVFAMDSKVKDVIVQLKNSSIFTVIGQSTKTLHFTEEGDQVVEFELQVDERVGSGRIEITATGAGESAKHVTDIQVRASNPEITQVKSGVVSGGQTWKEQFAVVGMEGTNKVSLEISSLPPLNLEQRLRYLIQYPHGCIEQTTSAVFPQLFLMKIMELNAAQKPEITNNIKAAIDRLKGFQLADGGMSYWPEYYSEPSEWGTNYAGHFLMEAEKQGYALPSGFKDKWVNYQRKAANAWRNSDWKDKGFQRDEQITQAYRLYTLALSGNAELGAMNRLKEVKNLTQETKWRLATAYLLAGKDKTARTLAEGLTAEVVRYKELSGTYGSDLRDKAMILEAMTYLGWKDKAKRVLDDISNNLKGNSWYSTQTTAYCLMAVGKFVGAGGGNTNGVNAQYRIGSGEFIAVTSKAGVVKIVVDAKKFRNASVEVKNNGGAMLFTKIYMQGVPLMGDATSGASMLAMQVKYYDFDNKEINPLRIAQGTDFYAEVKINPAGYPTGMDEMALTQIFPSGWEIRNTRMDLTASDEEAAGDKPEHIDFRDDRVYTYFDLKTNDRKKFRVILHAAYQGDFYLPTVYCEAMYDHEINARSGGRWVKVLGAGE